MPLWQVFHPKGAYTAEDKQGDGDDLNLVVLSHHAVRQLMEQNGGEEKKAGDNANSPMLGRAPVRMFLRELHGQLQSDEKKNNHPTGMQIDGDAENPSNLQAWSRRHFVSDSPRRSCLSTLPRIGSSAKRTRDGTRPDSHGV